MVSTTTDPVTLEENFTSVNNLIKSLCEVRGTEYVIFSNRRPGRNIRCMYGRIFNRNTGRIRSVYDANTAVYDCKSPTWITEKYGTDTAVYVQNTVHERPFSARLHLFTGHCKLSLGRLFIKTNDTIDTKTDQYKLNFTSLVQR